MSLRRTAFAAIGLALLSSPSYAQLYLDVNIGTAPPAPRYEVVPRVRPGYVWAPGYWDWRGGNYVWVGGRWFEERPGYVWVPDRWDRHDGGWRRYTGHWAHTGDDHDWDDRHDWDRHDDHHDHGKHKG